MNTLQKRMIQLRNESGKSQAAIAEMLGMKTSTYCGYESEGKRPRFEVIAQLAKYYGVSTDFLIGLSEERNHIEPVFLGDEIKFEELYNAAPAEIRPVIATCFTSLYKLIYDDVMDYRIDRLREYSELLEVISILRTQLKEQAESLSEAANVPLTVSNLLELQENLKSRVAISLERLLQTDLNTHGVGD